MSWSRDPVVLELCVPHHWAPNDSSAQGGTPGTSALDLPRLDRLKHVDLKWIPDDKDKDVVMARAQFQDTVTQEQKIGNVQALNITVDECINSGVNRMRMLKVYGDQGVEFVGLNELAPIGPQGMAVLERETVRHSGEDTVTDKIGYNGALGWSIRPEHQTDWSYCIHIQKEENIVSTSRKSKT
ncbi:hypothetical protein STEG23_006757, partial [Scotinomys teguina]